MTTAPWLPNGRIRPLRRLLAVVAIAAITIGCVADTSSLPGVGQTPTAKDELAAAPATPVEGVASSPTPAVPIAAADGASRRRAGAEGWVPGKPLPATVPVLYYHRVQALPDDYTHLSAAGRKRFTTYDVLPAAFAAQLDWLRAHGYTTILPRDLVAHWDEGAPLPDRPVIITFDDGSHDWVKTVLPMLQARGMVAEFYLTLQAVAHGNLTWHEARRLVAAGNGLGAHDVHHVQLAGLPKGYPSVSAQRMWSEVSEARRIIGVHVGVFPDSMAYVGGGYDPTLEKAVKDAGYTSARTIVRGVTQDPKARYRLRVVRIGVHDDVTDLRHGTLKSGLPTFTARMRGVSDKPSK
jgi:peptidoglycan/xylan/chitin deacetylase (PgdA/CDA1 family)